MRIVAGTLRGRSIEAPSGDGTRPTTDRVREALFSSLFSLRGGFDGAIVLDAFAGSGALGLEAVSRGAARVVFFERDAKAVSALKRNITACKLEPSRATVMQRDVMQAPPLGDKTSFDLVFLDPPYDYDPASVLDMMTKIAESGGLLDEAIVVYEHAVKSASDVESAAELRGFEVQRFKKYGKTGVSTLIWNARS